MNELKDNNDFIAVNIVPKEIIENTQQFQNETTKSINTLFNKIDDILNKIQHLEKIYVSMNAELIAQNIRMSESLLGKLPEPEFEMPNNIKESNESKEPKEKPLFYYEINNKIVVHGPGTYDNRPILKQHGEWNSINKTWDLTISMEQLLEKFPNITEKQKS